MVQKSIPKSKFEVAFEILQTKFISAFPKVETKDDSSSSKSPFAKTTSILLFVYIHYIKLVLEKCIFCSIYVLPFLFAKKECLRISNSAEFKKAEDHPKRKLPSFLMELDRTPHCFSCA